MLEKGDGQFRDLNAISKLAIVLFKTTMALRNLYFIYID